jgi:rSAM/selenodomain-associated transferase 2
MPHSLSVIIPTLNEEKNIEKTITRVRSGAEVEIIVVDGGSSDNTIAKATTLDCTVIETEAGRAAQLNAGAAAATGKILLFLHADTFLPDNFAEAVYKTIHENDVAAGAFQLTIDSNRISARIITWLANWRSRLFQLPYGDQALFMTRDHFIKAGTFPEIPLMEDFELVRKLRRQGKIITLPIAVRTSDRRWSRLGFWRATLLNQIIVIAYLLGVPADTLAGWYRKGSLF